MLSLQHWPEPCMRNAVHIYLDVKLHAYLSPQKRPPAFGNTSLTHNRLRVSGRWRWWGRGSHQCYSGLRQQRDAVPAQPRAPRPSTRLSREGGHTVPAHSWAQRRPLRYHAITKRLSSSPSAPAITYTNPTPLPTRSEASRICFQSSVLSLIPHCPAAVPGHFLWLGARQTVFSSTDRHPFASWARLGCYSMIGTISPVLDTSELHLG